MGGRGGGKQDTGWRAAAQECSRLPTILLRMVCSSLTLISMSWGKREEEPFPLWGKAAPRCPRPPGHHAQPTSPASCLKRDLKFSSISSSESTCWMEKRGRAGQGHPSLAPAWAAAGGRAGTTHQLCVTSPLSLTLLICKTGTWPLLYPCPGLCGLNVESEGQLNDEQ